MYENKQQKITMKMLLLPFFKIKSLLLISHIALASIDSGSLIFATVSQV